jgi:hypothetical protein
MKTDDTQAPDDRDINRLQGIPEIKVELRPVPDAPGQHLLFVGGQQISGFSDTDERDFTASCAPESALDNEPTHPAYGAWARWFIDLRMGVLSEGQVCTLTGLDRVKVREIDDLFNQALTAISDTLIALGNDPRVMDAMRKFVSNIHAQRALTAVAPPDGWPSVFNRTFPPFDVPVLFLLDEDGRVGVGTARFDHDEDNHLCSSGSYYEFGGNVWEGENPIGWLPILSAAPEVKP